MQQNWILGAGSNIRMAQISCIFLHTNFQLFKDQRIPSHLPLKQIRMIANLPKLHHKVHQILHSLLIVLELEQISGRNLVFDSLIQ